MKYAIEMGSSVMIYMPSFIKIGSAKQLLAGSGNAWKSHKAIFIFFFSK
jgi:hypothetical protein